MMLLAHNYTNSPRAASASVFIGFILICFYQIATHAIWGQSLGKALLRLKVVSQNGQVITWKQSLIRFSVMGGLMLIGALSWMWALHHVLPKIFYYGVASGAHPNEVNLLKAELARLNPLPEDAQMVVSIWMLAEVISLIRSPSKQAIHDRMAKTVVLRLPKKIKDPSQ